MPIICMCVLDYFRNDTYKYFARIIFLQYELEMIQRLHTFRSPRQAQLKWHFVVRYASQFSYKSLNKLPTFYISAQIQYAIL